jgi:hypothetical protein
MYDDIMNTQFDTFISNVFSEEMDIIDALAELSEGVRETTTGIIVY